MTAGRRAAAALQQTKGSELPPAGAGPPRIRCRGREPSRPGPGGDCKLWWTSVLASWYVFHWYVFQRAARPIGTRSSKGGIL